MGRGAILSCRLDLPGRRGGRASVVAGSSGLGRVLKRRCSHMYCSGALRTAASISRLARLASARSSPLG